jgi:hypothetical protein
VFASGDAGRRLIDLIKEHGRWVEPVGHDPTGIGLLRATRSVGAGRAIGLAKRWDSVE